MQRTALASAALVLACLFPTVSSAYSFEPTDLEWASWPEYCRARYVTTNIGEGSKLSQRYSQSQVLTQRRAIGEPSFLHVHHYCAGIIWLSRAKIESRPEHRKSDLEYANTEISYTFDRIPDTSPIYPTVAVNMGRARLALGDPENAIAAVEHAVEVHPTDPRPYIGMAVIYRDMKKLDLARDALLKGDTATEGSSAEIQYTLGLVYFELNDKEQALAYARKAYAKDYPLPGLQQKLKRAGYWPD
jgi:tetratricopeptide (TPR) repeat protein